MLTHGDDRGRAWRTIGRDPGSEARLIWSLLGGALWAALIALRWKLGLCWLTTGRAGLAAMLVSGAVAALWFSRARRRTAVAERDIRAQFRTKHEAMRAMHLAKLRQIQEGPRAD